MKKILTIALAIAMVATMSVTAFAATVTEAGDTTINVQAKYETSVTTPDVISVDVVWDAMEFTYSASGTKDWNPATHTYTDNTNAAWSSENNTVTVTNHSNVDVKATFAYAAEEGSTVTGTFDKTTETLTAGVEGKPEDAANVTAALTLGGTLADTVTTLAKVGTITVGIAKA